MNDHKSEFDEVCRMSQTSSPREIFARLIAILFSISLSIASSRKRAAKFESKFTDSYVKV